MIFNTHDVEALYTQYQQSHDPTLAEAIHTASRALIEAIAVSVSPEDFKDLTQEEHLKLQQILTHDLYDPARGSLYSFLSATLRNRAVDVMRRERVGSEMAEEWVGATDVPPMLQVNADAILYYEGHRFPSIRADLRESAAHYVLDCLLEGVCASDRGIIKGLQSTYDLSPRAAVSLRDSSAVVLRLDLDGGCWMEQAEEALALVQNGTEWTLLPEVWLCLGADASRLGKAFKGMRLRF